MKTADSNGGARARLGYENARNAFDLDAWGDLQDPISLEEHFDALLDPSMPQAELSRSELGVLILRRIYQSSFLTLVYAAVLLVNLVIVLVAVMRPAEAQSLWFLCTEALITFAVVHEVTMRIIFVGCDFFNAR